MHYQCVASKGSGERTQDRLFLVQESCLLSLFKICHHCGGQIDADISRIQGSFIRISQVCRDCSRHSTWSSQTFVSGIPLGNLILSASILFTGARPHQALKIFDSMKCQVHNVKTYMRHQRQWLYPVIQHVWQKKQDEIFDDLKEIGIPLNLDGDGRRDSPGHSAKYGSYTFLDLDWNKVIHQELVQSNEVSNSNAMELEALKRGLQFFEENQVEVASLVTDRHRSVAKYLREEQDLTHYYDVWHVAKGVTKKLQQLAKKKTC
ncbi:uncharacterized protein [Apostichopus japonicus]|uniref:uncharacterized protein n=1 Tax=Stichopus japonicus TaxID=307972 RepID=UPI003AB8944F